MKQVITIYDAKTNFSRLVKRAKDGEVIYIGAYGQPSVMLVPFREKSALKLGVLRKKYKGLNVAAKQHIDSDPDIVGDFERSSDERLPG